MNERRIARLLGCASFLFFLLFQHGHFKGSDELAIFEMTASIYERGELSVPALRHTEVGVDGSRHSYFAPGQAVLAVPLYALADPLRAVLPDVWVHAIAGPPNRRGAYRFGGELEASVVGLFAPLMGAVLVGLFYRFERDLGVPARSAIALAALLAASTHTLVLSSYFLRHSTETVAILGAVLLFRRYAGSGDLLSLAAGSAMASLSFLVRVPAALAAPVLALYLAWVLHVRGDWRADRADAARRLLKVLAAIVLPLAIALAIHAGVNEIRWGNLLGSPMVEQQSRFNHPMLRGLAGLLLSPGSSIFVYSPLLLLSPFGIAALWRQERPLAMALLGLTASWLLFYARFDGWSGLWSAPGPRYMFLLVPLLLLPLGLWLRGTTRWALAGGLGILGFGVQVVSSVVRWGSVPSLAGYPANAPDQAEFLFEPERSPVAVMAGLLADGGPMDSWLWNLWHGWPGFAGSPVAAIALVSLSLAGMAACGWAIWRSLDAPPLEDRDSA